MLKVTKQEFLSKLFESDKQGKQFRLHTSDWVYRDDRTGEVFGKSMPLVNGFDYYLGSNL